MLVTSMRSDRSALALALDDVVQGALNWRLWCMLGWQDIRQRYRRSTLGPLWLTLSMAILIGTLGFLFGRLWQIDAVDYLPFLTVGLIAWGLISGAMIEGCNAFIHSGGYIRQMRLPLSSFVYRVVWRNVIILGHNLAVYVIVAAYFRLFPGWALLWALPGLLLLTLNGVWVGLLFGMISARFRDFPQIVAAMLQPVFYVTPIIWKPELITERFALINANPFFHLIELLRAPLLGTPPAWLSWQVALGTTLGGWALTMLLFRSYRNRIPYWI